MSHREKSLTPWITNETHGEKLVIEHKMPTSEQMRAEIKRKIDAGEPLGASHMTEIKGRVFANGSVRVRPPPFDSEYAKLSPSNKPRWPCRGDERKHISEKYCGGIVCQMGLNGKCVACAEDD